MGSNFPDLNGILLNWWGDFYQSSVLFGIVSGASNIVVGTNPPYSINDFLAIYPQFAGPQSFFTATLIDQSQIITNVAATGVGPYGSPISGPGGSGQVSLQSVAFALGQLVTGNQVGIPPSTFVQSFNGLGYNQGQYGGGSYGEGSVLLTNPSQLSGVFGAYPNASRVLQLDLAPLIFYQNPFVPIMVLQLYVNLANACIFQARYKELWPLAMALFIAHMCTLFVSSAGQPTSTAAQVAAAGLQTGILTSESVGGVSAGYANAVPESYLESYGPSWGLTTYGVQLLSIAHAVAPQFVYVW